MIALALLLAFTAPDESLADQIVRCGVARDQIAIVRKPETTADIATIATPSTALTSDHLACLVGLVLGGRMINFADAAVETRFTPLIHATMRRQAVLASREWLDERGLLDGLPIYDPARQTLAQYGAALEAFCGVAPGRVLTAVSDRQLYMRMARFPEFEDDPERLCIGNAAYVTDPDHAQFVLVLTSDEDERLKAMGPRL